MKRIAREKKTLEAMVTAFCRARHGPTAVCTECAALLEYSVKRLQHCRYHPDKPACSECPTHCYRPEMRERIREVMRYAGPRLMFRHPLLAILHQLDVRRSRRAGD